jgi:glyoxylase-like metal-dependent hydrolase (beta-lactamase superfamily II)
MRSLIFASALSVAVLVSAAAAAQPRTADPAKRGFKAADFPRVTRLADNIYGFEGLHPSGMPTVSLFVVGNDGVLIADGQSNPANTQQLLDAIAKVTPKPVKWYIVASDHGDHTGGNSVLPKDITYVVTPASKAALERMKNAVVPPAAMSGDRRSIDVGGIEVQAIFAGRAHTGGDLLVYLPKQKLLFMSEVYLNRVFPAMRSAYPSEWVAVLDKALAMDVDLYVPGHGFIENATAAREELVEYRKAMRYVIDEVKRLHKLGLSAEDAARQANWGPYKDWYLAESQAPIAIRKVYEEIEGKLK